MDVYMAPLIDELKVLWQGLQVTDISRPRRQSEFIVKVTLMWTMHDFPGYGECSGKIYIVSMFF